MDEKDIIPYIFENQILLDAFIHRLTIDFDQDMTAHFYLSTYRREEKHLVLSGIEDFSFNLSDERNGYLISSFKLFRNGDLFYLSLDPFGEGRTVDDRDNNVISFRHFQFV